MKRGKCEAQTNARCRKFLRQLAKKYGSGFRAGEKEEIGVLGREGSPIRLHFVGAGKVDILVYVTIRTSSWEFDGERTDLHDALSISLACILRVMKPHASSILWDEFNPAVAVPEVELYGRRLTFAQPWEATCRLDREGRSLIGELVERIFFFEMILPRMTTWSPALVKDPKAKLYEFEGTELESWSNIVRRRINRFSNREYQVSLRRNPHWMYLRMIKPAVSVFLNPLLVANLRAIIEVEREWETVSTPRAEFYSTGLSNNALTHYQWKRASALVRRLPGEERTNTVQFIPLENYCVALGEGHLVCWEVDCGGQQFRKLREEIRAQHECEAALLFRRSQVTLNTRIDDESFEEMIGQLLRREPNINRARKMGHARQPDGGKDILVEWDLPRAPAIRIPANSTPQIRRTVLVQCKASKRSVGKANVRDIRDLLEHNDATGFLLVTSSYLTVGLIEQLIKIRNGGTYWADWWTKTEIEFRLERNLDIAHRFSSLLTIRSFT